MRRLLTEPLARRWSPLLNVMVLLCFLLPFASVSCDAVRAEPLLAGAVHSLQGRGPSASREIGQIDRCLASLQGRTFTTYTGLGLATGSDPSVSDVRGEACAAAPQTATARPADLNLGAQSLAGGALVAVALALLFGMLRFRSRGLVVAILSGVAIVLLALDQNRLETLVADRVGAGLRASGSSLTAAVGDFSSYFVVSAGLGFWLAVILLGASALYNSAASILGAEHPP